MHSHLDILLFTNALKRTLYAFIHFKARVISFKARVISLYTFQGTYHKEGGTWMCFYVYMYVCMYVCTHVTCNLAIELQARLFVDVFVSLLYID